MREEELEYRTAATLVHLYRGEVGRSDGWRGRLDNTTNWALTVTAAVSTFAFSQGIPAYALIVALFLVFSFLVIETRRYRYYDLFIRRVRLLEVGFLAPTLRSEPFDSDALRELAQMLERPHLGISWLDALSIRMGRSYGALFGLLLAEWIFKLFVHPTAAKSWAEIPARAHVGVIPGDAVLAAMALVTLTLCALFVRSRMMVLPRGEVSPSPRPRRLLRKVFEQQHV